MKNVFVLRMCALVMTLSLFACSDDKKAAPVSEVAPSAENQKASVIHPTEQKMYDFIETYFTKKEAAIAEPDDNKAITLLNNLNKETKAQATALKAELASWSKTLSEEEQTAVGERLMSQPFFKKAFEQAFDTKLIGRLNKNPKLKEAYEDNEVSDVFQFDKADTKTNTDTTDEAGVSNKE